MILQGENYQVIKKLISNFWPTKVKFKFNLFGLFRQPNIYLINYLNVLISLRCFQSNDSTLSHC